MHLAYSNVERVENASEKVYAISQGALMSVDKEDGQINYYNKLTGLSSSNISKISYSPMLGKLLVTYSDGNIDLLDNNENVENISDLYNSQTRENKTANDVVISGKTAYMAMDFGVIELNLARKELKETYIIGKEATSVSIHYLAILADSLYAVTADRLYSAALAENKIDYRNWNSVALPSSSAPQALQATDKLYLLQDSILYEHTADGWKVCLPARHYYNLRALSCGLAAVNKDDGIDIIVDEEIKEHLSYFYGSREIDFDEATSTYWFAYGLGGVGKVDTRNGKWDQFKPVGPLSNVPYRIRISGNRLYVVPGGYWAVYQRNLPCAMYYEDGEWTNFDAAYFQSKLGKDSYDYSDILGDPADPSHFFIAAFSVGLLEFRNNEFYKLHNSDNAPFTTAAADADLYTWVDGLAFDEAGNLWVENFDQQSTSGLCVLTPEGKWTKLINQGTTNMNRSKQVIISNKNPNIKVVVNNRAGAGIGVMDDNGTINNKADDKAVFRHVFTDQDGKEVAPEIIRCIAQDNNGELWVGTGAGLFIIPDLEQMLTSDACRRVIIMRTDGSELGDYLLGGEQINAIEVDGANRKWIGTQYSGLFLMSADGKETIEHFTIDNSLLPDNGVASLALNPHNGQLFVGTGAGLVSYQTDAAEAEKEMPNSNLYVYPNPVRENFEGVITITGLMENTSVKITDSAGLLVAETVSLGSIATWDGRDGSGKKVSPGVYLAQCVTTDGQHALTKILVMR